MSDDEYRFGQYKLYVEMADKLSARRNNSNLFYSSLLSGLLVILSLVFRENLLINITNYIFILLGVGIMGTVLCLSWFLNIRSYRQLNFAKFEVIHEMEQDLPYECYKKEWDLINQEEDFKTRSYLRLTKIEQAVPIIFMILYSILIVFSIFSLLVDFFQLNLNLTEFTLGLIAGIGIGYFLSLSISFIQRRRLKRKKKNIGNS